MHVKKFALTAAAPNNGHLTTSDRQTIHKQQNQESRRIDRDKHNAKVR